MGLESFFSVFEQVFPSFTITNCKKRRESAKNNKKQAQKGVYQHLGATLKCWFTPKRWSTPAENVILI